MTKVWDKPIKADTDWGGDASTGGLPVSGRIVQEFIKDTLASIASAIKTDEQLKDLIKSYLDEKGITSDEGFVTLATEQIIKAVKDFEKGLKINGSPLIEYDAEKDALFLPTNLVVRGAITMFGDKGTTVPSIWASFPYDNETIKFNETTGKFYAVGGGSGGLDIQGVRDIIEGYEYVTTADVDDKLKLYVDKTYVEDYFVSRTIAQDIKVRHDFTDGLKIEGLPMYKSKEDTIFLDANLVLRGSLTMFGKDTTTTPSIFDLLPIDNETIKRNENGQLYAVAGGTGGGVADSVAWSNITGKPDWIGADKPSYSYSEITDTPDLGGFVTTESLTELLSGKADKATTLAGYGITDAYTQDELKTEFAKYLRLSGEKQSISAIHDFTNGLLIDGLAIKKSQDKTIYIDGNLVVSGAMTMFGKDSTTFPTIWANIPFNPDHMTWDGSQWSVVGGGGVSVTYDSVVKALGYTPLSIAGGTIDGKLELNSTATVNLNSAEGILCIGSKSTNHISIDANDIQAKSSPTTAGVLYLNTFGGKTVIGSSGYNVVVDGNLVASNTIDAYPIGSIHRIRLIADNTATYLQAGSSDAKESGVLRLTGYHASKLQSLNLHSEETAVSGFICFNNESYPDIRGNGSYLTLSPDDVNASKGSVGLYKNTDGSYVLRRAWDHYSYGVMDLGASGYRWHTLYAQSGNFTDKVTAISFVGSLTGNADSAKMLQTKTADGQFSDNYNACIQWIDDNTITIGTTGKTSYLRADRASTLATSQSIVLSIDVNNDLITPNKLIFTNAGPGIILKRTGVSVPYIRFTSDTDVIYGEIGVDSNKNYVFWVDNKWTNALHADNYNRFALPLTGGTINGKLNLDSTSAVNLNGGEGILCVGPASASHISIDGNDIQAKSSPTTASTLYINTFGGKTVIGNSGYNVAIGGDSATEKLTVHGNIALASGSANPYISIKDDTGAMWYVQYANNCLWFGAGTAKSLSVDRSGNVVIMGALTFFSQASLKNVINREGLSLDELSRIRPARFKWKDGRDDRVHVGAIADEIVEVLPEVVYFTGEEKTMTMDYASAGHFIATSLIKPVIDHEERIKQLETQVKTLEQENNKLKQLVA